MRATILVAHEVLIRSTAGTRVADRAHAFGFRQVVSQVFTVLGPTSLTIFDGAVGERNSDQAGVGAERRQALGS